MTILAIIPAAGKGSRLNIKKPKIMVRVGRKLIIDILIEKIQHLVEKIIFVVNPKYAQQISNYLKKKYKNKLNFKIINQSVPRGMADAIFQTRQNWKNYDKILFLWGDHIGVSEQTIQKLIRLSLPNKSFALPLVKKSKLYVEYFFSKSKLIKISESREGDQCSKFGFSDAGVFLFKNSNLLNLFSKFIKKKKLGKITKEQNFLQFMVYLSKKKWLVKIIKVKNKIETLGINTKLNIDYFAKKYEKN